VKVRKNRPRKIKHLDQNKVQQKVSSQTWIKVPFY